jgi:hypothetical protein
VAVGPDKVLRCRVDAEASERLPVEIVKCAGRGFAGEQVHDEGAAVALLQCGKTIGYRVGGTDLGGVGRYLTRWFPGAGPLFVERASRFCPARQRCAPVCREICRISRLHRSHEVCRKASRVPASAR